MEEQLNKKKVAILGGSFDPPTIAHILIGIEVINRKLADECWLIPTGYREDKISFTNPEHRLQMTKLFLQDHVPQNFPLYVNDIEVKNGKTIKTYFLLKQLSEQYPQCQFHFILGGDLVNSLEKWDLGKKLIEEFNFIIFKRSGYLIDPLKIPQKTNFIEELISQISSTEIRKRIQTARQSTDSQDKGKEWLNIFGYVSKSVITYIKENNLYI